MIDCAKLEGLFACAQHCGWFWPFRDVCILTAKPVELHRDHDHNFHNDKGMAIRYADGFGLWRWHGVAVTEDVILHPELITTHEIDVETNQEVKRVLISRYGEGRYLEDSNAELIQEDQFGKLYKKEIQNDEPIVMVRVVNATPESDGTHQPYFIRVPPVVTSAHEAVAWTFGLTPEQYQPTNES
jgi:hypothetical protein